MECDLTDGRLTETLAIQRNVSWPAIHNIAISFEPHEEMWHTVAGTGMALEVGSTSSAGFSL
jgi:hypothetical protein